MTTNGQVNILTSTGKRQLSNFPCEFLIIDYYHFNLNRFTEMRKLRIWHLIFNPGKVGSGKGAYGEPGQRLTYRRKI